MKNKKQSALSQVILSKEQSSPNDFLILSSPTDLGVQRNNGRNGARYAPKAIINVLKKFNNHSTIPCINIVEVSDKQSEKADFKSAQLKSSEKILQEIRKNINKKHIHIGGGHDHVYPLLLALDTCESIDNLLILNIDAHLDTRVAKSPNSGTPFRDYDNKSSKPYHLIQYGIHKFANSTETMEPLKKGSHEIFFQQDLQNLTKNFSAPFNENLFDNCPFKITEKTAIILSLDSDAIAGESMKAVSAVNAQGLPLSHIAQLLNGITCKYTKSKNILGIYEYNPIYDDLSQLGSRSLANLIYNFIE